MLVGTSVSHTLYKSLEVWHSHVRWDAYNKMRLPEILIMTLKAASIVYL